MLMTEHEAPTKDAAYWLDHYLSNWSHWMRSHDDAPERCPSEASGGLTPYLSLDTEGMCERMDNEHAETTHFVIWTLPEPERNAIYFEYGIISQVEIVRLSALLVLGRKRLEDGLRKRGLWFGE